MKMGSIEKENGFINHGVMVLILLMVQKFRLTAWDVQNPVKNRKNMEKPSRC